MTNFKIFFFVLGVVLCFGLTPLSARMNGVEYLILKDKAANPPAKESSVAKEDEEAVPPKKTAKKVAKPAPKKTAKKKTEKKPTKKTAAPKATVPSPETQEVAIPQVPVIVIDPGHGGKDPGAISKAKIREKDIVLAISRQLAAALRKKLGAKVYLTRGKDAFITLGDRNRVANKRQADIFLSIHGNASTNKKAEGIEIYYLNKATDAASERLAARENAGSPKEEADLDAIVSDLLQTAATEESAELAKRVKGAFEKRLRKKHKIQDVTVKTALFYVLVGAKCPSLLIETGFVTHPKEGKRLTKIAFQKDMANAIAEAVTVYWKTAAEAGSDL